MAKKSILKRGFKKESEELAIKYRTELGIDYTEPLCGFDLCSFLKIPICKATEFITSESEILLLKGSLERPAEWSALTMIPKSGIRIIIHNPFATGARQQSDLMHEVAHVICKHEHNKELPTNIPFGMRDFDPVQEEEAKCLGSTLQLPRETLLWAREEKMTNEDISNHFNASIEMVRYRINSTGVDKQMAYRKKNYGN